MRIEERGNELGGFIFDIEITILKSGEGCHQLSFFKHNTDRADRCGTRRDPMPLEPIEKSVSRQSPFIHAYCYRRDATGVLATSFGLLKPHSIDPSLAQPQRDGMAKGQGLGRIGFWIRK